MHGNYRCWWPSAALNHTAGRVKIVLGKKGDKQGARIPRGWRIRSANPLVPVCCFHVAAFCSKRVPEYSAGCSPEDSRWQLLAGEGTVGFVSWPAGSCNSDSRIHEENSARGNSGRACTRPFKPGEKIFIPYRGCI